MKVCTDACLFGAWSVRQILNNKPEIKNVLDIGTGTGLLSLMLAQHFHVPIDAVEINPEAASQAEENFHACGWKNLKVHHTSIADFPSKKKYDFIIANPPFYDGDLLSPDENRNAAMHNSYLTLVNLLRSIKRLLADEGYAAVLLPASREVYFKTILASNAFQVKEMSFVRQTVNHDVFRVMFLISLNNQKESMRSELSIHDGSRQYTPDFKRLLKDYYLAF